MNFLRLAVFILFCLVQSTMLMGQTEAKQPSVPVGLAQLHASEMVFLRNQAAPLREVFSKYGVREVLWSGAMITQSGGTPVAVVPVRAAQQQARESVLSSPIPYAMLYFPDKLTLLGSRKSLDGGTYLLVFQGRSTEWDTRIINAKGETVASLTTQEIAFEGGNGKKEDVVKKAEELLKKKGFDIKLVDIEVEFNGSTEVFVSFLFWRWSLFEDPPLPY